VFEEMEKTSTRKPWEGEVRHLWEGYSTKLVKNLNLSVPYYSSVLGALRDMGCIIQLRRGGGSTMSVFEMVQKPTEELWNAKGMTEKTRARQQGGSRQVAETQRQRDLSTRVADLETDISALKQAMIGLQKSIDAILKTTTTGSDD
jgi:hypothetical protein